MPRPRRLTDVATGDWVNDRLLADRPPGCRVGSVVPTGFARVVRVLHPVGDGGSWAQVAAEAGRSMHPLVQWGSIAGHFDGSGRSGDRDPDEGSVPAETLGIILERCPAHEDLVFAVWAGYGSWENRATRGPLMRGWGGRDYLLFSAPKAPIGAWPGMHDSWPQSANLIWPSDHSWCIATEIDWDSTLIAGEIAMTDEILADTRLEAFEVSYDDDLSVYGDIVNPRPAWLR
jgi:hypothetical protein